MAILDETYFAAIAMYYIIGLKITFIIDKYI